ncbi:TPA: hypothetical protein EYP44_03265 [Candidatus Bathyarchaeota archaeon]|nr:hypothetical protein [Candidatus Bathyarchaeota archaeon]
MYWWKGFDEGEVRGEFKEIRDLSLKVVRIFLLWEDFQPRPREISADALGNLEAVLDIAQRYRLRIIPTLLIGFMSGLNWIPRWALEEKGPPPMYPSISQGKLSHYGIRDLYEDPAMLRAERLLIHAVVSAFKDHPSILAWDISNEIDNLRIPRSPLVGRGWNEIISREIKRADPHHPVTLGLHQEDLEFDKNFHLQDMAIANDFISMHGYPIFSPWADGPMDSDVVPFLNVLAEQLGQKPVLFEEFGVPTSPPGEPSREIGEVNIFRKRVSLYVANEEEAARYYSEVLNKLHLVGSLGALAWCFSDYDPSIWNRPPLDKAVIERHLGVTRSDGSIKPMGKVLQEFASQEREVRPSTIKLEILREKYYLSPYKNLKDSFRRFKKG